MKFIKITLIFVIFFVSNNFQAFSQNNPEIFEGKHSSVSYITEYNKIESGKEMKVILNIKLHDDWHSYWENPGDSGFPVAIETNDKNIQAISKAKYQIPEVIAFEDLVNFGYHDETNLIFNLKLADKIKKGKKSLNIKISYLICKDICIPEIIDTVIDIKIAKNSEANPKYETEYNRIYNLFANDVINNAKFNISEDKVILIN